jgi:hypothetical protein
MNRKRRNDLPGRYYDIRLVLMYVCLLAFYIGLNCIISMTLHTPVIAEWIEVRPGFWNLSNEIKGLLSLRTSLCFFELNFGCLIAALLCGGKEESEGNPIFWWVFFFFGLPVIVNFVSDLWIWITYTLGMILSGWLIGKKTGFVLPIGKEIWTNFKEEINGLVVVSRKLGRLHFRGNSAIIIIVAALLIPLAFAIYYYAGSF